jgi:exodeoxyribonuclease VII large subunit
MPYFVQISFMKPFEPSSSAAAARGPNAFMPFSSSRSTSPITSGCSGPTTTRSTASRVENSTSASISSAAMATHSASWAIPALPGAHHSLSQSGEAAMAQHSECSRPPDPTTSIFMLGLFRLV